MLTAQALMQRGFRVIVLDRGPFGREASWAGGGILSPLYPWRAPAAVQALVSRSQILYPELIADLQTHTGVNPEWRCSGLLILNVQAELDAITMWSSETEHTVEWFEPQALLSQPVLCQSLSRTILESLSVYLPTVAQVRNPRLLKAMHVYLQDHGVLLFRDSDVATIEHRAGRVTGVRTVDGERYYSNTVVVANGAWSGRLLEQLQLQLPIRPVRGQMLLLQAPAGVLNSMVLHNDRYLIPRADGRIVVGSTVEEVGFDKNITDAALIELRQFADALLPALHAATTEKQWAGLRPGCGDGIPYISQHPEIEGVFVNAGHFRNGIVMAPASAELLADLMTGATPIVEPQPYAVPDRYLATSGGVLTNLR